MVGNFENLNRSASAAFEVIERVTGSEHHFPGGVDAISGSILADSTLKHMRSDAQTCRPQAKTLINATPAMNPPI